MVIENILYTEVYITYEVIKLMQFSVTVHCGPQIVVSL